MSNKDQAAFWSAQDSWINFQPQMDICLRPVLDLALEHSQLTKGQSVLDIGCGTGASVSAIADIVGPSGHVLGVDIAQPLLDMARARCGDRPNVTLELCDAQTAVFPVTCDTAVSRFGVMFFEDTPAAFANIARGLKPGAQITCAAWAAASDNPFFMTAAQAAREIFGPMPKFDRSLPGPFAFENSDRVLRDFTAAGLSDVTIETVPLNLTPEPSLEDFAKLCMGIGPAASALNHFEATHQQADSLKQALIDAYAPFSTSDTLRIPASIHIIQAHTAA